VFFYFKCHDVESLQFKNHFALGIENNALASNDCGLLDKEKSEADTSGIFMFASLCHKILGFYKRGNISVMKIGNCTESEM